GNLATTALSHQIHSVGPPHGVNGRRAVLVVTMASEFVPACSSTQSMNSDAHISPCKRRTHVSCNLVDVSSNRIQKKSVRSRKKRASVAALFHDIGTTMRRKLVNGSSLRGVREIAISSIPKTSANECVSKDMRNLQLLSQSVTTTPQV
ncbi:hypothetical protein GCK32_017009, partial [Trichostrongylus colubriformis]